MWTVRGAGLASRATNTPYEGMRLPATVVATVLRDGSRRERERSPDEQRAAGARGRADLPRRPVRAAGQSLGEAVFVTAMSGYQETLTDPSYHGQIVVQTAPQIGNTGWNDEDDESSRIQVAGVVRDRGDAYSARPALKQTMHWSPTAWWAWRGSTPARWSGTRASVG